MNRYLLLLACFVMLAGATSAQKNKNKKKNKDEPGFDSTAFLREFSRNACECIDSVNNAIPMRTGKLNGFAGCIDKQVTTYQLAVKLLGSMQGKPDTKEVNIVVNSDKNSNEYKQYYYDIERWLKDSCEVLNRAISTHDEPSEKSYSDNPDAMEAYDKGVAFLKKENYADAIPWFEKAVGFDDQFAFAWDNLGICYRRTDQFEKAEAAYKASLKADPSGKTPLQNLPVVYLFQKKNAEAITAYQNILVYYPDDPEAYYGLGLAYINYETPDLEKALDNMCKAYNIYVNAKSPFRSDAEKVINAIYTQMKKENKEETFNRILKENNIKSN